MYSVTDSQWTHTSAEDSPLVDPKGRKTHLSLSGPPSSVRLFLPYRSPRVTQPVMHGSHKPGTRFSSLLDLSREDSSCAEGSLEGWNIDSNRVLPKVAVRPEYDKMSVTMHTKSSRTGQGRCRTLQLLGWGLPFQHPS